MKVAPQGAISKHPFEKWVDSEQVFVMGCRHGEHRFDARTSDARAFRVRLQEVDPPGGVTPAGYNVVGTDAPCDARPDDRYGNRNDNRMDVPMTALLTAPLPEDRTDELPRSGRPELRLVQAPVRRGARHRVLEDADDGS